VTHIGDPQFGQVGRSLGSKFGVFWTCVMALPFYRRERGSVSQSPTPTDSAFGWRSYLCRVRDINSPVPKDVVLSITALNRMNMVAAFAREKVDF
jgi:hypothetical protein